MLQFFAVTIFSWIFAPFYDGAFPIEQIQNSRVILSMVYLGFFATMMCFIFQNVGLKYLPSTWASLLLSFESVFGVIFSVILLGEKLTLRMGFGCALIFTAVVLAQILPEIIEKRKQK